MLACGGPAGWLWTAGWTSSHRPPSAAAYVRKPSRSATRPAPISIRWYFGTGRGALPLSGQCLGGDGPVAECGRDLLSCGARSTFTAGLLCCSTFVAGLLYFYVGPRLPALPVRGVPPDGRASRPGPPYKVDDDPAQKKGRPRAKVEQTQHKRRRYRRLKQPRRRTRPFK